MQYLVLGFTFEVQLLLLETANVFYLLFNTIHAAYNVQKVFLTDKCEEIYDMVYEYKSETFNIYLWPQLLKLLRYMSVVLSFMFG